MSTCKSASWKKDETKNNNGLFLIGEILLENDGEKVVKFIKGFWKIEWKSPYCSRSLEIGHHFIYSSLGLSPIVIKSLGIHVAKLVVVKAVGFKLITNKSPLDWKSLPWISPLDLSLSPWIPLLD